IVGRMVALCYGDGSVCVSRFASLGKTCVSVELQFMFSRNTRSNQQLLYALRRFDIYARIREGQNVLFVQVTSRADIEKLLGVLGPYSGKAKKIPSIAALQPADHEEVPSPPVSAILAHVQPRPWRLLPKTYWSQLYDLARNRRKALKATLTKLTAAVKPWLWSADSGRT